ncbi:MAG: hypothetical protein QOC81_3750 [Thermoanaerobaculia bacterium]|jgi:hypothetical protein|nr:hypothetical protein [Thermoanaerobaculia bacterium]
MSEQNLIKLLMPGNVYPMVAYHPPELTACLEFEEMIGIVGNSANAREGELRHIAACTDCSKTFCTLQRNSDDAPQPFFKRALQRAIEKVGGVTVAAAELCETYATHIFALFRPATADHRQNYSDAWGGTHALSRAIRKAIDELPPRAAPLVFDACAAALIANAKAYAGVPHSLDTLWPMLEVMQEAAPAADLHPRVREAYIDLWTTLIEDAPITVRTIMQWGLWELAFRAGDTEKIAVAALRRALKGPRAHEVAPVAALVYHMHPKVARYFAPGFAEEMTSRYSPELNWMVERAATVKKKLAAIFVDDDLGRAALSLANLLDDVYQKPAHRAFARGQGMPSMRWQLISTIIFRAGIVQALGDLPPGAARERRLPWKVGLGMFRDNTDRRLRSLYAELRIFHVLRAHDPYGWSETMTRLLPRLPDYERHGVVRSVVTAYENGKADWFDPRAPRFVHAGGKWTFQTPVKRPFDGFCSELALLSNDSDEFRCHLVWANSRFEERRKVAAAQSVMNKPEPRATESLIT